LPSCIRSASAAPVGEAGGDSTPPGAGWPDRKRCAPPPRAIGGLDTSEVGAGKPRRAAPRRAHRRRPATTGDNAAVGHQPLHVDPNRCRARATIARRKPGIVRQRASLAVRGRRQGGAARETGQSVVERRPGAARQRDPSRRMARTRSKRDLEPSIDGREAELVSGFQDLELRQSRKYLLRLSPCRRDRRDCSGEEAIASSARGRRTRPRGAAPSSRLAVGRSAARAASGGGGRVGRGPRRTRDRARSRGRHLVAMKGGDFSIRAGHGLLAGDGLRHLTVLDSPRVQRVAARRGSAACAAQYSRPSTAEIPLPSSLRMQSGRNEAHTANTVATTTCQRWTRTRGRMVRRHKRGSATSTTRAQRATAKCLRLQNLPTGCTPVAGRTNRQARADAVAWVKIRGDRRLPRIEHPRSARGGNGDCRRGGGGCQRRDSQRQA